MDRSLHINVTFRYRALSFKIGLLGLGTVGTGTAQILLSPAQRHPLVKDLEIHRVGVRSLDKPRNVSLSPDVMTTDLDSIVSDPEIEIVSEIKIKKLRP